MNRLMSKSWSWQQSLWLFCALVLVALVVNLSCFVVHAAMPVIRGDDWYYTITVVRSYLDGHLGLIDFFAKRGPGENAQPLNRLILLALVRWFDMDFWFQGVFGTVFAVLCVALFGWLFYREPAPNERPNWLMPVLLLALGAVFFSLNASGDYTWPLVTTLVYSGTFGVTLYIFYAARLSEQGSWLRLALLTLLALLLLDTFATLAVLGTALLIISRVPGSLHKRRLISAAVSVTVTLVVYQSLFAWLTGIANSPLQSEHLHAAFQYLLQHGDEAWKILVVPFAAALYEPAPWLHDTWQVMPPLAVIMWGLNAWFWWCYVRRRGDRLAFLAAGLMLYSYATAAGMLVDRIPQHGFDYLLQQRYVAFYQLQVVALIFMWGRVGVLPNTSRRYAALSVALCVGLLALNVRSSQTAWTELPSKLRYEHAVVAQINALAREPVNPPASCLADITPCRWSETQRREVLEILESHQLNVFSAKVRSRHGYVWQDLPPNAP